MAFGVSVFLSGPFGGRRRYSSATAAERFNYLYSDEELEELAPKVRALEDKAEKVHALFNNCHSDKGGEMQRRFVNCLEQGIALGSRPHY
jgi:uncharacterized protein YecE (DUF72 family)